MERKRYTLVLFFILVFSASTLAQSVTEINLTDSCVQDFDADVDYFPIKSEITHADGLEIEYFNHYKVVTVLKPWPQATENDIFQYVLVQCGTPIPAGFDDAQIIEIPSGDVIALSTTQLPHLAQLGLLDHLIGLDSILYTNTPEVVELIENDALIEVGSGSTINIELVLDAEPDLVMAFAYGNPDWDTHPILLDANIPTAMNSEWVESSPLGRAEWIKFTAVFFNKEAEANAIFDEIVSEYTELTELANSIPVEERPTVLLNIFSPWDEAWNVPGADSYTGQLLRDAGVNYVLNAAEEVQGQTGSVPFDFEVIYDQGLDANYWLTGAFNMRTLNDLLALDERYIDFSAVENNTVFNNNARENANGGNDFYETGVTNPNLVLADYIKVFHPELLPDHELIFLKPLANDN